MRIEPVDPVGFASQASSILTEAWQAPCLVYGPDYLAWQFRFPGPAALGVAAMTSRGPAGFAAATPRRLRFRGSVVAAYLVSFVAVRPAWRGHGVASGLYAALLGMIRESGHPIVTFAQADSNGKRLLERVYPEAGFHLHSLGLGPVLGFATRRNQVPDLEVTEAHDLDEIGRVIRSCEDRSILRSAPGSGQFQHLERDPRDHVTLIAWDGQDQPLGMVRAVRHEVVSPTGIEPLTMVESIALPQPHALALKSLLIAAARRWARPDALAVLTVPNASGVDQATRDSVGLRRTASRFVGYVSSPDPMCPAMHADATDLEIT